MSTGLIGDIPLSLPYSENPRTISGIPNEIVDWVLIELRETSNGTTITSFSNYEY